jgi:GINS complex subunit 3
MQSVQIYRNATSNPLVTLDFPPPLQQRVINALKADPRTVDLRAQAPHFYSLGARMLEMFEDENVVDVLTDVSTFTSNINPQDFRH